MTPTLSLLGTDLAILSSCNHTILSYGTFSFWSGFLSNGKRIIPSMITNNMNNPLSVSLGPFDLTDKGLEYEANHEKITRLGVTNLISF